MEMLTIVALVALGAVVACAAGKIAGPIVLALGFGFFGIGLLGTYQWGPALGLAYLGGAVTEVAAVREYWRAGGRRSGPSTGWRLLSTGIGAAGSIGLVVLVYAVLAFMAWLSAIS